MLLLVEKGNMHVNYQHVKANNKYMKDYDKDKESLYHIWDVNNLYEWTMSQKLPLGNFKWVEETPEFKPINL